MSFEDRLTSIRLVQKAYRQYYIVMLRLFVKSDSAHNKSLYKETEFE